MSNRKKKLALLRSRVRAAEAAAAQDPQTDEKVHRMIAAGSRRPSVAALASKPDPLTPIEKSAIFMNAANAVLSDHGGRQLRELKQLAKTRRISLR